jgi:hypothetical protein
MSINKFGFDEDYSIYCMSLAAIARDRREAAEAEAKAAAEKAEAVNAVFTMLVDAIKYLERDIPYLKPDEIAEQFMHSLSVNNVPVDIIESAVRDYLNCREYNDTIELALQLMIKQCTVKPTDDVGFGL